jgi:hypothetical protein
VARKQALGHLAEVTSIKIHVVNLVVGGSGDLLNGIHQSRPADVQRPGVREREGPAGEEDCCSTKIIVVERSKIFGQRRDLLQLRSRSGNRVSRFHKTLHGFILRRRGLYARVQLQTKNSSQGFERGEKGVLLNIKEAIETM